MRAKRISGNTVFREQQDEAVRVVRLIRRPFMKKFMFVLLAIVIFASFAMAQVSQGTTTSSGPGGSAVPTVDVLGAHNNYGRGCAGCHAPHSGAAGAGGNGLTGTVVDTMTGANALFAQDMGPLYGKTFDFSDVSNTGTSSKYLFTAPSGLVGATVQGYSNIRGIVMCLACHDGATAKGAMMQNQAYEQQIKALPSSYGTGKIPTLLGADGSAAGYNNDHPVGESATISAAMGKVYGDATNGLTYVISGTGSITSITPAGNYKNFMASYGAPALMKGTYSYPTPVNAANVPYIVCTTCHNQHVMNIYAASTNSPIAGAATGTYATYFFVNGPYNVNNVTVPPTQAASTTQFCRQCHFAESNEANGATGGITTSF
jgi:hypothetical protein